MKTTNKSLALSFLILFFCVPSLMRAQSFSYLWSTGDTTATINVNPLVNTTYYVEITYGGITYFDSVLVTVQGTLPTPTAINGPSGACAGQSNVVFSTPAIAGASQYNWTLPAGVTGSSTTDTIVLNFGSTFTGGVISVTAQDTICATAPFSRNIVQYTIKPNVPGAINGPATAVCSGTIHTYSVVAVNNATSYTWGIPAGCSILSGQGTNSIELVVPLGFVSGNLTVNASNCIGTSNSRLLTIRGLPALPGIISGITSGVCELTSSPYSVASVLGASSYQWNAPVGSIISNPNSNSTQITFPQGFLSGTVSVQALNACGAGLMRSLSVRSSPRTPTSLTGQLNNLCGNNPYLYTAIGTPDVTSFSWTVPGGASFTTPTLNTAAVTFPNTPLTGFISVVANNFCGASTPRTITVTTSPTTPASISGPSSVCAQQQGVTFSVSPVNGANSLQWQVPSGASITAGQGSPSVIVNFGSSAGLVKVQAVNACALGRVVQKSISFNCRTEEALQEDFDQDEEPEMSAEEEGFEVFPNPAAQEIFIRCNTRFPGSDTQVALFDVLGRQVFSGNITSPTTRVDISNLPAGMYFLRESTKFSKAIRIIKQ